VIARPKTFDWPGILAALEQKNPRLEGYLQHARVLAHEGDKLELGFPDNAHIAGEIMQEPKNTTALKEFLREHLGRSLDVKVKLLDEAASAAAPARSAVEETREKAAEDRKKRESEAREHPATKLVLETFGVQIKEIKTDV
jgi:hypothetical protein